MILCGCVDEALGYTKNERAEPNITHTSIEEEHLAKGLAFVANTNGASVCIALVPLQPSRLVPCRPLGRWYARILVKDRHRTTHSFRNWPDIATYVTKRTILRLLRLITLLILLAQVALLMLLGLLTLLILLMRLGASV